MKHASWKDIPVTVNRIPMQEPHHSRLGHEQKLEAVEHRTPSALTFATSQQRRGPGKAHRCSPGQLKRKRGHSCAQEDNLLERQRPHPRALRASKPTQVSVLLHGARP